MHIREELLSVFQKLDVTFEKKYFEDQLNEKVESLLKFVESNPFSEEQKRVLSLVTVLATAYGEIATGCKKICVEWADKQKQHIKNINFRDNFDNALIVYVYGKVKAGKSALGNFIAYGDHNPSQEKIDEHPDSIKFDVEIPTKGLPPEQRKKDERRRAQMQKERKFVVDLLEATNCIQYFTMPGLVWVDSPGIHSTTKANGDLAKGYLQSADVVIFATTSRSACQEGDVRELVEIAKSEKPFIVLVTRCDELEEDEIDGELVKKLGMRSEEDMHGISKYALETVKEAVEKACPEASRKLIGNLEQSIILASCLYAEKNPDENGWRQSGMEKFARRLIQIAESDGKRSKMQVPLKTAYDQIGEIKEGLETILGTGGRTDMTSIKQVEDEIRKLRSTVQETVNLLVFDSEFELERNVDALAGQFYGNDEAFFGEAKKLAENITQKQLKAFADKILKNADEMLSRLSFEPDLSGLSRFTDITQTKTYHTTRKGLGAILGGIGGGIVGFILGGPIGASIGASLGGTAGGAAGNQFKDGHSCIVKVGDNRLDVARETTRCLVQDIKEYLQKNGEHIDAVVIDPLEKWLGELKKHIEGLKSSLEETQKHLESSIKGIKQ